MTDAKQASEAPSTKEPVTDDALPPDPDAYDSPRAAQARARGLAAPYIAGGLDPEIEQTRREERRYLRILIAMIVVVVLSGFVLGALQKLVEGALGGPSQVPVAAATAAAANSEPASPSTTGALPATAPPGASPVPGPLADGVPTTLDGVGVVHGLALLTAASSTSDDTEFLAGGWFHAEQRIFYCSLQFRPTPLWSCPGMALYLGPSTKIGVILAPGAQGPAGITIAEAAYRPVVLRAHTHDARCPAADTSCPDLLVLDEVAWVGASLTEPLPTPLQTPPPPGFSRQEAIAKAKRQIAASFELTSATIVHSSEATNPAGPLREDPWVWYLRFHDPGSDLEAWVVLDYMTGRRLGAFEQTG